ncbi:MAG: hypothetical protein WDO18_04925 [Acidobacteriota bacterium]
MRIALVGAAVCATALAQQPFYTDDADVTERHRFHLEISNQQSWLQRSALPATKQSTTVFQLNYGLTSNFEIGMDGPLIALYQQQRPHDGGAGRLQHYVQTALASRTFAVDDAGEHVELRY